MPYQNLEELRKDLAGAVKVRMDHVEVLDPAAVRGRLVDRWVRTVVFGGPAEQAASCWLIRTAASAMGIESASIQEFYEAMGREEASGFTVPAINLRGMTYDMARAAYRAAVRDDIGALVFEIARSEIDYTFQRPAEYLAVIAAAALKEGVSYPIFVQGDHFQVNAKKFKADPEKEMDAVRKLAREAVEAGFYNIDIDTSTLVDLDRKTTREQQRENFERAADLTHLVRQVEPEGVTVSVGGEIGEVGGKNSTIEEFRAFMDGYLEALARRGGSLKGISKISVQTGTSHGGVPLPDGTVAKVALDFDVLRAISTVARKDYGLSGAVQHGASTLPEEAFDKFPECGCSEVHLATGFQNMFYDHEALPRDLKYRMYRWLADNCAGERKPGQTDEQFMYSTRKKGFGPFKRELWDLSAATRDAIGRTVEDRFTFLFERLNVSGTRKAIEKYVKPTAYHSPAPQGLL